MGTLINLVRAYRFIKDVTEEVRLAEEICGRVEPDLSFFVFGLVPPSDAPDVLQITIKDIVAGLRKFKGDSEKQLWAWCYCIARNKISDHFRRKAADRSQPMAPEELHGLLEKSVQHSPVLAGLRHDLDYAMKTLTASKPECFEFLWQHYVFGLDYSEIAEERSMTDNAVRMRINRCLDEARKLVT